MRKVVLLVAAVMVLSDCAPTVTATSLLPAPPQPADHEILLFSAKVPSCPFDELGLVSVEEGYGGSSDGKLLVALQRQARRMGGDAVVKLTHGRLSSDVTVAGSSFNTTSTLLSGTVIRFTDASCRK